MSDLATTITTPTTAPEFRFALRVYWEDTDAGGVVFYANYLKFFERARTEWLRASGCQQEKLRIDSGVMFVVSDASVRYLQPARLDDLIDVTVQLRHAGRAQMTIAQQAWRRAETGDSSATLLAEATIRVGCVDAGTFRPQRIPTAVSRSLNSLDA
ncbi:MAG: tol-pal system-associated acyl-CoA thioesterase [Burkholderiaceae bacterium]